MDFTLITVAAAEGLRAQADVVEVTQYGHYNDKLNLWAICKASDRLFWSTWLYV